MPLLLLTLALLHTALSSLPDSSLNATEVVYSGPERAGLYLGSPSILRCPSSSLLLISHDTFGSQASGSYLSTSSNNGTSWQPAGSTRGTYWATLFSRPGDPAIYALGTSTLPSSQIVISRSLDCGSTFSPPTPLTSSPHPYSTGPTPVLLHNDRLWRAFELNAAPGWASGYSSLVLSIAANASSLLDASAWTVSSALPFSAVSSLVPPTWSNPSVLSTYGWLEGNAVAPVAADDPGIHIVLRVNSLPAGNKAALLYLASSTAAPSLVSFIDFPGGMSKFTIRKDTASGLYLSLVNPVADESVTHPPLCAPLNATAPSPSPPLPCCSMNQVLACTPAPCLWCHANARNVLSLATSPDLLTWNTSTPPLLTDDTAQPSWLSELTTGFQYVDFVQEGRDLLAAVRAGYRGSQNYHNSNRILFMRVADWAERS